MLKKLRYSKSDKENETFLKLSRSGVVDISSVEQSESFVVDCFVFCYLYHALQYGVSDIISLDDTIPNLYLLYHSDPKVYRYLQQVAGCDQAMWVLKQENGLFLGLSKDGILELTKEEWVNRLVARWETEGACLALNIKDTICSILHCKKKLGLLDEKYWIMEEMFYDKLNTGRLSEYDESVCRIRKNRLAINSLVFSKEK